VGDDHVGRKMEDTDQRSDEEREHRQVVDDEREKAVDVAGREPARREYGSGHRAKDTLERTGVKGKEGRVKEPSALHEAAQRPTSLLTRPRCARPHSPRGRAPVVLTAVPRQAVVIGRFAPMKRLAQYGSDNSSTRTRLPVDGEWMKRPPSR